MKKLVTAAFLLTAPLALGGCNTVDFSKAVETFNEWSTAIKKGVGAVRSAARDECGRIKAIASVAYQAGEVSNSCKWQKIAIKQYEGVKAFCDAVDVATDSDIKALANSVSKGLSAAKTAQASGC